MKYYAIVDMKVRDRDWMAEYIPAVSALVQKYGGTYLSRTMTVEKLEGDRETPDVVVILEFPSKEAAEAFYGDPEYAPYLKQRIDGTQSNLILVAGEDIAAQ